MATAYRSSPLENVTVINSYVCPECNESTEDAIPSSDSGPYPVRGTSRFYREGDIMFGDIMHYCGYRGDQHACLPRHPYKKCRVKDILHEHVECFECKFEWIKPLE